MCDIGVHLLLSFLFLGSLQVSGAPTRGQNSPPSLRPNHSPDGVYSPGQPFRDPYAPSQPLPTRDPGDPWLVRPGLRAEIDIGLVPGRTMVRKAAWTPVRVRMSNQGEPFTGSLTVRFDGFNPVVHRAAVDLPKNSRKDYDFFLRVPLTIESPFVADVTDATGRTLRRWSSHWYVAYRSGRGAEEQFLDLSPQFEPEHRLALVLGPPDDTADLNMRSYQDPTASDSAFAALPIARFPKFVDALRAIYALPDASGAEAGDYILISRHPAEASQRFEEAARMRDQRRADLEPLAEMAEGEMARRVQQEMSSLLREYRHAGETAARLRGANELARVIPGGLTALRERTAFALLRGTLPWIKEDQFVPSYYHDMRSYRLGANRSIVMGNRVSDAPNYFDEYADKAESVTFLQGSLERLPDDPIGYTSIDYLVIDGADPEAMTAAQRRALVQWLRSGGQLVACGGDAAAWQGTWLADLVPALLGERGIYRFPANETGAPPEPWSDFAGRMVVVHELTATPRSTEMVRSQRRDLVHRGRIGHGVVATFAFSLRELAAHLGAVRISQPPGGFALQRQVLLLEALFPSSRPRADFNIHGANVAEMTAVARATASQIDSADTIFFLGLAFVVLSVGANAWIARRLRRPLLFWPVLLAFCVFGVLLVTLHFGRVSRTPIHGRHLAWLAVDAGSRHARGTSFVGIEASYPARIAPSLRGIATTAHVFPVEATGRYEVVQLLREGSTRDAPHRGLGRGAERETVVRWSGEDEAHGELAPRRVNIAEAMLYGAAYQVDLGGAVDIAAVAPIDDTLPVGGATLRIHNGTRHDLVRVVLYEEPGIVYPLGDLAAGASTVVETARVVAGQFEASVPTTRDVMGASFSAPVWRGLPATDALRHLMQRPEMRRLDTWSEEAPTADAPPSVIRTLLGLGKENEDLMAAMRESRRRQTPLLSAVATSSNMEDSPYYFPSDPPFAGYTLVAELASPAVGLALKPRAEQGALSDGAATTEQSPATPRTIANDEGIEGLQVLAVRMPRHWLTNKAPASEEPMPLADADAAPEAGP